MESLEGRQYSRIGHFGEIRDISLKIDKRFLSRRRRHIATATKPSDAINKPTINSRVYTMYTTQCIQFNCIQYIVN